MVHKEGKNKCLLNTYSMLCTLSCQPVPSCENNVIIIMLTGEKQELRGYMDIEDIV